MKDKPKIGGGRYKNSSKNIGRRDFIRYTALGTAGAGVVLLPGWMYASEEEKDIRFNGLPEAPDGEMITWYRKPAEIWDLASPLGNGSLGIMAFGSIKGAFKHQSGYPVCRRPSFGR